MNFKSLTYNNTILLRYIVLKATGNTIVNLIISHTPPTEGVRNLVMQAIKSPEN